MSANVDSTKDAVAAILPTGRHEVKFGETFGRNGTANDTTYHALRFDFKPKSVNNDSDTYIAFGDSNDVTMAVPNESSDANFTWYKGAQKSVKGEKECLLLYDHDSGELRIEQLASNISVKRTRGDESGAEQQFRHQIERLREKVKVRKAVDADLDVSSSGSSSDSDDDKSNCSSDSSESADEDHLQDVLEEAMQRRTDATNSSHTNTGYSSSSSLIQQQQQQQQQLDHSKSGTSAGTRNHYTTGIKSTTLLDGDLRLSESSDDD